jgi:flagella basal body P-ring formation protein FlgA
MKTVFILAVVAQTCLGADCRPVVGRRILGGDLALADPRFAALPASLTLGFASAPGTVRTFTALELERIARTNGIHAGNFEEICFTLPMMRLKEEDVTAAMRRSLPQDAALRVVEMSKSDVPVGEVEFPMQGLVPATPANPSVQLWRGAVKYAESLRFDIWARVEVSAPARVVVPVMDLPSGVPVSLSALGVEVRAFTLSGERPLSKPDDVTGKLPRHLIRAGSPITRMDLIDAPIVRKGDVVTVQVESGLAHLRFDALAVEPGRAGDVVELRNPSNGKAFRARLEAGPSALIVIPARPIE